jgi:hypothetical protein
LSFSGKGIKQTKAEHIIICSPTETGRNKMGYTHYWTQNKSFSSDEWLSLKQRVGKIINWAKENGIKIVSEFIQNELPIIDDDSIQFNGYQDEGHETFCIKREFSKRRASNFCKTAGKPYDLIVCLTLIAIGDLNPDILKVTSDGEWGEDWHEAECTYQEIFGKKVDNILSN